MKSLLLFFCVLSVEILVEAGVCAGELSWCHDDGDNVTKIVHWQVPDLEMAIVLWPAPSPTTTATLSPRTPWPRCWTRRSRMRCTARCCASSEWRHCTLPWSTLMSHHILRRPDCLVFSFFRFRGTNSCYLLRGCSEQKPPCAVRGSCVSGRDNWYSASNEKMYHFQGMWPSVPPPGAGLASTNSSSSPWSLVSSWGSAQHLWSITQLA